MAVQCMFAQRLGAAKPKPLVHSTSTWRAKPQGAPACKGSRQLRKAQGRGSVRSSVTPGSMANGGEVGNISLQSDTHRFVAELYGVPAEDRSDRTERQAEAQFIQLELLDLPRANTADFERHREWLKHEAENRAACGPIDGDAPSAGGGLQAVDDNNQYRPVRRPLGSPE